jgi:hypothetical protein
MATPMGNQYGACVGDTFPEDCDSCLVAGDEDCSGAAANCTGSHVFSKGITNVDGFTGVSVIALSNGEILVAGTFSGGLSAPNNIVSDGSRDIALIRFDADGNAINAREFGGAGNDSPSRLVLLDDGYLLVGTLGSGSAETFGAGATLTAVGSGDGFAVKFNNNHTVAWKKLLGGSNGDTASDAVRMPDGGVVVTGAFNGTMNAGGSNLVSAAQDTFVVRFASDGSHIWSFGTGSNSIDGPVSLAANSAGQLVLVTETPFAEPLNTISTFTPAGALSWSRTWETSSTDNNPQRATIASDGSVWVGGYFDSSLNVDGVPGADFSPTGTGSDLLFVKYSSTGALLGGNAFNGTSNIDVTSMSVGDDGAVLAAGSYSGSLFFSQFAAPSAGSDDVFLLKLDPSDGDLLWGRKHGGPNRDSFNDVTTVGCGDVLVVGGYRSSVDFGGGALAFNGSATSIDNGVLAKYRP